MRNDMIGIKDAAMWAESVTADHLTRDLDEYSGGGGGGTNVYGVYGVGEMSDFDVGSAEGIPGEGSGDGSDGRVGALGGVDVDRGEILDLEKISRDGRGDNCGVGTSDRVIPSPGVAGVVEIGNRQSSAGRKRGEDGRM